MTNTPTPDPALVERLCELEAQMDARPYAVSENLRDGHRVYLEMRCLADFHGDGCWTHDPTGEANARYFTACKNNGVASLLKAAVAERDAARAEVERLQGLMTGDAEVIRMEFNRDTGAEIEVEHWAVRLLAASFAKTLGEAPNYMEVQFGPIHDGLTGEMLAVTIQRISGKSPGRKNRELEEENARLQARIKELEGELRSAVNQLGQLEAAHRVMHGRGVEKP